MSIGRWTHGSTARGVTQGAGAAATDQLRNWYASIVPLVLDCYDDPHPLLRSVACLAMPKLVGRRLPGLKDPWSRVVTCTAVATRDPYDSLMFTGTARIVCGGGST